MFRRRLTFPQMAVAMSLGTAGGVYIYGPYFRPASPSPEQGQDPEGAAGPSGGLSPSVSVGPGLGDAEWAVAPPEPQCDVE